MNFPIDPNAQKVYTSLDLFSPQKEGVYLCISKSRWTTNPDPVVGLWKFISKPEGLFIHPHSNTPISCTHWAEIDVKLPL